MEVQFGLHYALPQMDTSRRATKIYICRVFYILKGNVKYTSHYNIIIIKGLAMAGDRRATKIYMFRVFYILKGNVKYISHYNIIIIKGLAMAGEGAGWFKHTFVKISIEGCQNIAIIFMYILTLFVSNLN